MRLAVLILFLSTALVTVGKSVKLSVDEMILNEIGECLLDKDAEKLSSFFNDHIEITLEGQSKEYAKGQARFILKEFLNDYPPDAFSFAHQGSTSNTLYALGTYRSPEGTFEVDLYLKKSQNAYLIDQIKFERKE